MTSDESVELQELSLELHTNLLEMKRLLSLSLSEGEIYTNMMILICDNITTAFILFSPQYGGTALHIASGHGHPEVVKLLVQSHADVNVKNIVSTE